MRTKHLVKYVRKTTHTSALNVLEFTALAVSFRSNFKKKGKSFSTMGGSDHIILDEIHSEEVSY